MREGPRSIGGCSGLTDDSAPPPGDERCCSTRLSAGDEGGESASPPLDERADEKDSHRLSLAVDSSPLLARSSMRAASTLWRASACRRLTRSAFLPAALVCPGLAQEHPRRGDISAWSSSWASRGRNLDHGGGREICCWTDASSRPAEGESCCTSVTCARRWKRPWKNASAIAPPGLTDATPRLAAPQNSSRHEGAWHTQHK